ncbi:MAG: RNA polymerase sigma factor [Bacteroidetes bacterium]|nr:MAG: RNA polymerase sigma factor [Bacteroidota bacterium]REJ99957.1 MAG: RNA polymerase sigma factor [Bacteroidota bacterium]REK35863.1 MAG: RNA polymerase sigma factor [Bacteroidota bacterium]REK50660.1 MAG: RNA polymerase sigma factor [Bacteroidota bacterium]
MTEFSDSEILEKFRDEKSKHYAFNLLVDKYRQRVYWHIRRILIDHEDANDVVQDVFLKVWFALDNFREESKLFTWLYRIATNESISFLNKKRKRFFIPLVNVEYQLAQSLEQDVLFTGDKIQKLLQQAILKLPTQQRIIFNMKYFDGLKYEEISEVLGLSVGGLKASYHHAVKKIEKFMENH